MLESYSLRQTLRRFPIKGGPVWDSDVFLKSVTYQPTLSKFRGGPVKKNTLYMWSWSQNCYNFSWGRSSIIIPSSCFHSKYLSSTDKTWPRGFSTALRVTRTTTRMSPFSRNSKIIWPSQEGQHHGLWQQKHNNKTLKIWGQRRTTTRHVTAKLRP